MCVREETRLMAFKNGGNEKDKKTVRYAIDTLCRYLLYCTD